MNDTNSNESRNDRSRYLEPGEFIESDNAEIKRFAEISATGAEDDREAVIKIYYAVRDGITYDPYYIGDDPCFYRASDCLRVKRGFCIPKAALMAACSRHLGVPARVGYADVRNHLTSPKLAALLESDIYTWHGYTEVFLDDCWVKATPAFNLHLCKRFNVHPLEFDGHDDSLFQEYDTNGRRHMEYISYRDHYFDVPYDLIIDNFRKNYPRWLANGPGASVESENTADDLFSEKN